MDLNVFKQVLLDQQKEKDNILLDTLTSRREEIYFDLESNLAQIVIGVRRSGKSTLCHKVLKQNNIEYAYVNFDDERLYNIQSDDLNDVLEALYIIYGDFKYLFCDEIQNIPSWFMFVNRLLRQKMRLIITGSNAKLLSSELSTHLTGRYNQIELFPFSFSEILEYKKLDKFDQSTLGVSLRKAAFEDYLYQGGFPELFQIKNKKGYIRNLFNSIILRDIKQRFSIRYPEAIQKMAYYLTETVCLEINYKNLSKQFSFGSIHTAEKYVAYLRQSYLLVGLQKFSYKSRERIRNEKNYVIDSAFISTLNESFHEENFGWRLENVVFLELLRRKNKTLHNIFYFKNGYEIDFVLVSGNTVVELIQVSADISSPKTFNREINALIRGSNELHCNNLTLITLNKDEEYNSEKNNISITSIINWLLNFE